MFDLCEDSGYLWNSFVYLDKKDEPDPEEKQLQSRIGRLGAVIISHIKELLGYSYNLYFDNWCTIQSLFEYLYKHGTVAAGTA